MLKQRGADLEKAFNESRILNFDNKYVLGEKLGEGQHASVYKCFKRINPRTTTDETTPLLARQMNSTEFDPTPFAVKIVRDDDKEKIIAHLREFDILKGLRHPNVVGAIEIFEDKFKNEVY
jgi:serine/threonine protein kinase